MMEGKARISIENSQLGLSVWVRRETNMITRWRYIIITIFVNTFV